MENHFCRPSHLDLSFLFPSVPVTLSVCPKPNLNFSDVVRIAASFDEAWLTRFNGKLYDSLTGYGVLVGHLSGKILAYDVRNRKCRQCDRGRSPQDHDCDVNFRGSAKSMESESAVALACHQYLKDCFVQWGIMISDNDSCAILSLRNALDYEIVKQADKNHTSKGVKNELYNHLKQFKELNKDTINYLQRCFNYCLSQNVGNCEAMADAIKNIPEHAFNIHTGCKEDWCQFLKNPDTYKHKVIGDGFKDDKLYHYLKVLFGTLAGKSHQFVAAASSNPNEAFHSQTTKIYPKDRYYGGSCSAKGRIAFSVGKKNEGEDFITQLNKKCQLSPGHNTKKHAMRVSTRLLRRAIKQRSPAFKKRRLFLKQERAKLKQKHETTEDVSYQSNIGLLDTLERPLLITTIDPDSTPVIVFYDLETGGFGNKSDILQIAAKYENQEFSMCAHPLQKIDESASKVTGLRVENGTLCLNGVPVEAVSISKVLYDFYLFLHALGKKCVLTAHNGDKFDHPKLCRAAKKHKLMSHYESIVEGFVDTLPLTKKVTGLSGKGENTLEGLGNYLKLDTNGAHDATKDVILLEQITVKLSITKDVLLGSMYSWSESFSRIDFRDHLPEKKEKCLYS